MFSSLFRSCIWVLQTYSDHHLILSILFHRVPIFGTQLNMAFLEYRSRAVLIAGSALSYSGDKPTVLPNFLSLYLRQNVCSVIHWECILLCELLQELVEKGLKICLFGCVIFLWFPWALQKFCVCMNFSFAWTKINLV